MTIFIVIVALVVGYAAGAIREIRWTRAHIDDYIREQQ